MVRETRHLWVGNLPENIREDRIREHFKRYGRVQSVKLLPRGEECPVDGGSGGEGSEGGSACGGGSNAGGGSVGGGGLGVGGSGGGGAGGTSATVAFMDIKSAAKAHATEHTLDERALTTQYYEPQHLQHRFPTHGSSEDHGSSGSSVVGAVGAGDVFEPRGSHVGFYATDRGARVVGGGVGVVGIPDTTGEPVGYMARGRPPPGGGGYHVTSSTRARERLYPRTGPYVAGPPPPHIDRHRGSLPPSSWSSYESATSRYSSVPPPPSPAATDAYEELTGGRNQHKKQRRKSRSGSSSPDGSSRSGSTSSSRSGSSAGSSSAGSSSPGSSPHRNSNAVSEDRRPLAICVRNLPGRSSDTSLKDGLFHEYKKHGKVTWVKVVGAAGDRYALVCFKKPEDVEKALEVSHDKLFFGCKIEVAPYQGYDVEDNEFRPYEAELDEYHPKATRTLFIGNLEKDVTASELRKHFEPFGEIIEIDIKKQGAVSSYAFCQYSDISSVVKAMRSMDGEHLGSNRIKLGFGKSMPTSCVWVDGIGDLVSDKYINMQFHQFGPITQVVVDRERGHALVFFEQISCAQAAVKEMRGATLRGRRLQVDFASRECQEAFYEHLERQGIAGEKPWDARPTPATTFDTTRERSFESAVTVPSAGSRFTRYETPPRARTASYTRTPGGGSTPGASPAHPTAVTRSTRRYQTDPYYEGDYTDPTPRRFRSYDEFSQGSGASHDDYDTSIVNDVKLTDDDCPPPSRRHTVQSVVVTSIDPPVPPPPLLPPPDIRHLQKERVHLLEQLEECHSSGDEGFTPKKRAKLEASSLCDEEEPEIASLLVTSHSGRKGIDVRRVSESKVLVHHAARRGSCEGRGAGPCKRRRDTTRHHEHHDGSRPGTPLVDERPENLIPSEPRRFRERSHEGPLSLPLPRFAAQMMNNNNNNNNNSSRLQTVAPAKVASPPTLPPPPSPRTAPQPPASPPPRHLSLSPTSSDSETAPLSPSLEERIRSLDEKYEKWSGSRALSAAGGDALAKFDTSTTERFRFRHKLLDLDLHEVQPSDIVRSVLAKRSVFDEDSKRLENFNEKYEPKEFTGVIGVPSIIGTVGQVGCAGKVGLQYPFPSHPPIQTTTTAATTATTTTTTTSPSISLATTKADTRTALHNCVHQSPTTPVTPSVAIKTVSPELPPVAVSVSVGSAGALCSNSVVASTSLTSVVPTPGTSASRPASCTANASPSVTGGTTCPALSASCSQGETPRARLRKDGGMCRESRESRDSKDSKDGKEGKDCKESRDGRDSRHSRSKDTSRKSRKEEGDTERRRGDKEDKDKEERLHPPDAEQVEVPGKEGKETKQDRREREEKEKREKDERERQERREKEERREREEKERRDKEERDRREAEERERREQEAKEREERERKEREELEMKERERKEREERERRERDEKERQERKEKEEKEKREREKIDRERREKEEKERQERKEREERERREREEREKKEKERLEKEKQEKERLRREKEEQERKEKEERERLERDRRKEKEEKERLERERRREREEKERLERERRKEKEERERLEREKREKEEKERLEKERHEREKRKEREEREKREKEDKEKMEKERRREKEDKEKREREERRQVTENHPSQLNPAPIAIKRRCSSQDVPEDEAKRMRISSDQRRDSKDRPRQNRKSEDRKHRTEHRSSRESRDGREYIRESITPQDGRESQTRETPNCDSSREQNRECREHREKQRKKSRSERSEKEMRERSPRVSHEQDRDFLARLELSRRNEMTLPNDQPSSHQHHHPHHPRDAQSLLGLHGEVDNGMLSASEVQRIRRPSATDTDSDEPKKHSIFDIVDDTPAYISMYDKVKARSTKNMQKLEEEKRQVRLKDKFSQLKQSRARREEKKQSTSWDGDSASSKAITEDEATSESDSARAKSLSRKGSRSRIHSDTSEEEESFNEKIRKIKTERFSESDVDLGFADTEEKQNILKSPVANMITVKEEVRTSEDDDRISEAFHMNHPSNDHERESRKKTHKKKQKRQKNSISSEEGVKIELLEPGDIKVKSSVISDGGIVTDATVENAEERMRIERKQRNKKEKRRERNGEDNKAKARRKRLNRQEGRDAQRMEDIFGPLSDEDDPPSNAFFNRLTNIPPQSVYGSDSDGVHSPVLGVERRKKEKKRRHQPEDENSVDLAEVGREIEAKLLGLPSSPKASSGEQLQDHDVFRFTDDNDSVEPSTPTTASERIKEKKKKRKKSKEERARKDCHHHHHHEKTGTLPNLSVDPSPPRASSPLVPKIMSPTLPTSREVLLSPIPKIASSMSPVSSLSPAVNKPEKKKDKFIPGFGTDIDETIHENAVKSISEPEERDNVNTPRIRDEPEAVVPSPPPQQAEDKPRVVISQEETEDAVAALLEETFGGSTEDFSYEGEEEAEDNNTSGTQPDAPQEDVDEMQQAVESLNASTEAETDLKPDTPQSEHDLQIDTDTEEDPSYDTFDLTQPPKTPDIPSFYKSPIKTAPEKPMENHVPAGVPGTPPSPLGASVIAHSWSLSDHKPRDIKATPAPAPAPTPAAAPAPTPELQTQTSSTPPSQYKPQLLTPYNMSGIPVPQDAMKLPAVSPRPPTATQTLYQRLPVSPQTQMVSLRQASPKMSNISSPSGLAPLPPLVPSRIPPLVPSQLSPRVPQQLSPNGQWSRSPVMSPHIQNNNKPSPPPPARLPVSVPISAHRPDVSVQQIYSTAASQQPVIQHAPGMRALAPNYPRGGLPPLSLSIPPRPYLPMPPLIPGSVKNPCLNKSVIETLLPVNHSDAQRLEESKLSPAVMPESASKASTSPKVPSPNQPPTYIPETAKIEISAGTSSPVFEKPMGPEHCLLSPRQQKPSVITDSSLLSPRKQDVSNMQLLTTHLPRTSTPSPVIVAHSQQHVVHKPVTTSIPPVSASQPLIRTVLSSAQTSPTAQVTSVLSKTGLVANPTSEPPAVPLKPVVPLVSTVAKAVVAKVAAQAVPDPISVKVEESKEQLTNVVQSQKSESPNRIDETVETAQPMQLTPPVQPTRAIEIKEEEPCCEISKSKVIETGKLMEQMSNELDMKLKQEKKDLCNLSIKEEPQLMICAPKIAEVLVPKMGTDVPVKTEIKIEMEHEDTSSDHKVETLKTDDMDLEDECVDPLREPTTDPLALDPTKEDPTDSKEDSDYWSAKEVNIESVIKKVDALCDGEANDAEDETQHSQELNSEIHKSEGDWFDSEPAEEQHKKDIPNEELDEGVETCELESTRTRRGRSKSRRGAVSRGGGVTTRRGGRTSTNVSHRRGGRSSRGSKHHAEKKHPTDVYEFHDDSEEDNAGRPRLILTIKSPGPNLTGGTAQLSTPIAAVKEVPVEEFVSPAVNTRKSRRLAEKDGSRSTVDDVIEDVVRGSAVNRSAATGLHATRRSTRHNSLPRGLQQPPQQQAAPTEPRKSPRGGRKSNRRISETNDDSGEERTKETSSTPLQEVTLKQESPVQVEVSKITENSKLTLAQIRKSSSHEPMTLIDPVTGMLIPMRESEEGQYIPVATSGQATRSLSESQATSGPLAETQGPRPRSQSVSLTSDEAKPDSSLPPGIVQQPTPQQTPSLAQPSVISKPQSPIAQTSLPSTQSKTVTSNVIAIQTTPPTTPSQTKLTSLKAHVLNASKLANPILQPVVTKPSLSCLPNQTVVQNIIKQPVQAVQALHLQIPGVKVQQSLSPGLKITQTNGNNAKLGQPMSPVLNCIAPPNPKQHLLQAAKLQATSTVPATAIVHPQKIHPGNVVAAAPAGRIHQVAQVQPVTLKAVNGQQHPLTPKAHLLQAVVQPTVAGAVASPPIQSHLICPQPAVTGAICSRSAVPKSQVPGTMEPPKVEVSMSGCIMIPTASPQGRGVPIASYDAPLHGAGSASSPGGQYGLGPPHRSQSPPLPPPAHHHANASQGDVVNHYGPLTRGDLPPAHYMHSQVLYQQYLRAQQEAVLTTPRIPYHVPGTRSPHLPLDPKIDPGADDSHSPPLELRRVTRTPQDRTTDSPQVAQVYMLHPGARLPPQFTTSATVLPVTGVAATRTNYYEPPPAHLRPQHHPLAASEAPTTERATSPERSRKLTIATPPHSAQMPPQADSLLMLLQRYPVMWQGLLALKNDQAAVQMHFVFGNPNVARDSLPCNSDGSTPPLRIAQRMRLEQTQVEGVARKMQTDNEHCMLLALPCGRDHMDVLQQSKNLQTGFITYLQQKQAAGIVNIAAPGSQQPAYVVHIFPSCDFANESLARIAPDLLHRVAEIAHLLIVIATV